MEFLLVLVLLPIVAGYLWYVSLIGRHNKALEALAGIDVQLQKRGELIPNILTIAKKFMEHERVLLEGITALRERAEKPYDKADPAAVKEHLATASALQEQMGQLLLRAEAYPELKSQENMLQAQHTYNEVEEHISAARRFYNSAVGALNNSVQIFPGSLIASMAGIQAMPFYQAPEATKQPVHAAEYLD